MKQLFTTLVVFVSLSLTTYSQTWTQKASLYNCGRVSAFGCSANGKAYVGMGQIADGSYINDFWEYDPTYNHWTRKADFPGGGRNGAVAYSVKGKIFVFFGYDNYHNCHNDVWEYNPTNNAWTKKADFPGHERFNARGFVISDSLIFIGTGTYNSSYDYLYDFWMYNPSNNTWTQKSDFSGGMRMAATSFEINGIGYLGSGLQDCDTPTKDFWKYNPSADTWSRIADLPASSRLGMVNFVINNEAFVGLGDDYAQLYNSFYKYTPRSDSWSEIAAPPISVRMSGVAFTIGNKGFIGTGWDKVNYFTDFWAYDPEATYAEVNPTEIVNNKIKIYPNPTTDNIKIDLLSNSDLLPVMLKIFNMQGKLLITKTITEDKSNIDLQMLATGTYILQYVSSNLKGALKIIKQ